ncbi:MAG: hypothetical protein HOP36_01405 [Methyloglobulus sp.]|nr:hypothetical protein [Methyloglobulus sp.]
MPIQTPTGTPFQYFINSEEAAIVIVTQNENRHDYQLSALVDLYQWLRNDCQGEWVYLGTKREQEEADPNTVEIWARSPNNPVNGFYGLTPGRRGQFATYIPSILEHMGVVEIEHNARNNRVRAIIR